jgi:glycosyltransferase involved in cell wall biosynthesis
MRVLHATADWKWTGPAEPMLHAVTGLRALGHQVDLACPPAPDEAAGALPERCRERGVEPRLLFARRRGVRWLRDRDEVRGLRAALLDSAYDVVHVHHTRDHLLAWRASRGLPTRLVVGWHQGSPLSRAPWHRLRLGPRGADGLVVLSERIAESALAIGWEKDRVAVVGGSVDTDRFRPRPRSVALAREFGLEHASCVIGVVARLQPHRRFELLLDAFARARREVPGLRLLVVGRGTRARQVLEEPVRALGLEGTVVRAGYRREDYLDALGLMDALVFLVPGSDGSCRAVLEAMAMGIPTIASPRGILPETVLDGDTGRVVAEDPVSLSECMLDLWRDRKGWAVRGEAARRRALAFFTVEEQAKRLERLYRVVAGES